MTLLPAPLGEVHLFQKRFFGSNKITNVKLETMKKNNWKKNFFVVWLSVELIKEKNFVKRPFC
jgi:hypothetical protein